jgi:EAL domain-containing protein (putative c-di-GMP-specific phosphodiesterase class I)
MIKVKLAASEFAALDDADRQCGDCGAAERVGFQFDYAYQPIVDLAARAVYGHEALVRGLNGESAMSVLAQVTEKNRYRFDQACRVKAIKGAAQLGIGERLSINFLPNAIYKPEVCIRTTLEAARVHGFPLERIIFEVTEGERVEDGPWLAEILREYKRCGLLTAIDDFGAGYAGLTLLANFQPDLIKIDMELVRNVDQSKSRQAIIFGLVRICNDMGVKVIAEGIETAGERDFLWDAGIHLMQGYLFCRPVFQGVGEIDPQSWGDAKAASIASLQRATDRAGADRDAAPLRDP